MIWIVGVICFMVGFVVGVIMVSIFHVSKESEYEMMIQEHWRLMDNLAKMNVPEDKQTDD